MKVSVRVPATSANLGPGFDCLGLALGVYNTIEVVTSVDGLKIEIEGEGIGLIPTNATNLVYQAITALFQQVGESLPALHIRLKNRVPLMSGLGSSSAAIVGGLVAANTLLGNPLDKEGLLKLAMELEGHPDNVAPALLGGLVVVTTVQGQPVYRRLEIPELSIIVVTPDFRLATARARAALPKQVPLTDAVFNLGRTALVVLALMQADYDLLMDVMDDRLHQIYRMPLVPGLVHVFDAARRAGAKGVALSGAGPSVIAFAPENQETIAEAMREAFAQSGLRSRAMLLKRELHGAQIINPPSA